MKYYKVINNASAPHRVPGPVDMLVSGGASLVLSAKDFSLSLLKQNKAFSIEEIIVENIQLKDVKSKQSKPLRKEVTQSKGKTSSAKSKADNKEKVSDNG